MATRTRTLSRTLSRTQAAHRHGMLQGMGLVGILLLAQTLAFATILFHMGVGL